MGRSPRTKTHPCAERLADWRGLSDLSKKRLQLGLQAAVPLWQVEVRKKSWGELKSRLPILIEDLAFEGDSVFWRAKQAEKSAEIFNSLAEAIAILSLCPGGVDAFDLHFEAIQP